MRKFTDLRVGVRNLQTFNIGGGNREIDFAIRGPGARAARRFCRSACGRRRQRSASIDADTTLQLNKPELRARIDRARAADLGVKTQESRRRFG